MSAVRSGWFAVAVVSVSLCGCQTDSLFDTKRKDTGPTTRIDAPAGVDLPNISVVGQREVDLVEEMATHRAMYHRTLTLLRNYYREKGYEQKAKWAEYELAELNKVKPFKYIMAAEIPAESLRPTDSVAEADVLYDKGLELMKQGGHGVPIFFRESTMKDALKTFIELVTTYPNSDKIDDAAFYIGEIYKEYFKDQETIAVQWYARALEWNPKTAHPVRFQLAVVYDFRLHDRAKALEYYNQVLEAEPNIDRSNVVFSTRRIHELVKPREGEAVARTAPPSASPPVPSGTLAGDATAGRTP